MSNEILTPRTDGLLAELRHSDATDWNADDVMAFLKHSKTLEAQLTLAQEAKRELMEAAQAFFCYDISPTSGDSADLITVEKAEVRRLIDAVNKHGEKV